MTQKDPESDLRVLVVDDSAFNRRSISEMITDCPGVRVVGKAADGEEALRLVRVMNPDVVTLDLEMPKMDGFTFLRILMSSRPLPVIVVSSYSQKENVFKALELGALDFVAKPDGRGVDAPAVRQELLIKIGLARQIQMRGRQAPRPVVEPPSPPAAVTQENVPNRVVAVGSSTGGPSALMEILSTLPKASRLAVLVAQHMPDKFTRTFAERLDRRCQVSVREAESDDLVLAGHVYVCPGRRCMELVQLVSGELRLKVSEPDPDDRYVPSADRLFRSVGRVMRDKAVGVVLTGMGDDGARGTVEIRTQGGHVIAEHESSAVVYGMPRAALQTGAVERSLAIRGIAEYLTVLGRSP